MKLMRKNPKLGETLPQSIVWGADDLSSLFPFVCNLHRGCNISVVWHDLRQIWSFTFIYSFIAPPISILGSPLQSHLSLIPAFHFLFPSISISNLLFLLRCFCRLSASRLRAEHESHKSAIWAQCWNVQRNGERWYGNCSLHQKQWWCLCVFGTVHRHRRRYTE